MVNPDTVRVDYDIPSIDRITQGIAIIRKYAESTYMSAEHDIIYYGEYADTLERMTDSEQWHMFTYGWFEMDESWAFYV